MNVNDPGDPLLPPPRHGRHRSARERQRQGPMWRFMRRLVLVFAAIAIILGILIGGGWFYLGTSSFAGLVKLRVEKTLEARLGRDVTIGSVAIDRAHLSRVILNDIRIANAPGGVAPYFATVRQIEIQGGVDSFWGRQIRVSRVDIRDPRMWFEVFPAGATLTHNFPHWNSGPPSKYEIVHLEIGKLYVTGGGFSFNDRKHNVVAVSQDISSTISITRMTNLYEGLMNSPLVRVRIQDYVPFDVDMRGGFRYTPGVLALQSIALKGTGIEAFLAGELNPLTDGVYDLHVTSRVSLERVREIFRVNKTLEGPVAIDARLRGKQGDFRMTGGWVSPRVQADIYELTGAKGKLDITGAHAVVDVDTAHYGGGTIGAHYTLVNYSEPYPQTVDLRYNGVSIEQLFNDWTIANTGLRAAATGKLSFRWNKDKVLEGNGSGSATLSKNAIAFSGAKYPLGISGSTDFAIDNGVIDFRRLDLDTDASHIAINGTLRIEDVATNWRVAIQSRDFAELDRAAYNFAHSAGKKDYTLLGLGGAGNITATVAGPLKTPMVVAHVDGTGTKYNNILLGDATIDIKYDGHKSVLTFDRAVFVAEGGRIALTGTVSFPDKGPSPRFDIAADATGYPAQRAMDAVNLPLKIGPGLATGRLIVTGTPEEGKATLANLVIKRGDATLALNGPITWFPGKGNTRFDLDIATKDFPVEDITAFLDMGKVPVSGHVTGTLKIAGTKTALEGGGNVTLRNGTLYGEPIESATANLQFSQGHARATNVTVVSPAGTITGEAELDLTNERFSYQIQSAQIDVSRIKLLQSLQGLFGGKLTIKSQGAGTFTNPELVVEATLNEAAVSGLSLPPGSAPPSLYLAIRGGRLIIRGSIADIVTIEGEGAVGNDLAVDGSVRVTVTDVAKLAALSPMTATIPVSGRFIIDAKLGGKLSPIEALRVDATFPQFELRVSDRELTAPQPLHISMGDGRLMFDSFTLQSTDSSFSVTGFAEATGEKRLDIGLRGRVEAVLFQLFVPGLRADGEIDVTGNVRGTMSDPRITGTAEVQHAQVRFPGFPQLIDDINGTIVFKGDRIDIDSLRATVGGGKVFAGGFVTLNGMKPQNVRLTLQGSGVSIRYYEGVTVEGDFSLLVSGDAERAVVQGDVNVTRALYFRDFDFRQSLLNVILSRKTVQPVVSASWQDRVSLRVHLSAPGTLAVKNNIADVTGSAEIDLNGTLANPVVLGEVTLNEGGTVRIQDVDYRVVRGTVAFQNPFRIDPYFDVTIEGRVAGNVSEIESGPIDVTINLTGTIDRMTPTITSDPPASDITLFSVLGFGGLTGNQRTGATNTGNPNAALVGQSLLYQTLISSLGQRILPFADSFTYDPGLLETGTGAGPTVTFEKRVSSDIRLLVVYYLDQHQSREVLEWVANREWTLQLARDEASSEYRVDARFRRRYDAHWTWGNRGRPELAAMATMGPLVGIETKPSAPLPPAPPTTTVRPPAPNGKPVAAILFRADARFDTSALNQYVTLRLGEPLSVRELQTSIKNLFATGNFRDIRVDSSPAGDGVNVTFALYLHYRVGKIHYDGLHGGERTRAEREIAIHPADVFSLNAVDDSANALQEQLRRDGFLEATVDPETNFDRARSLADITFHITPGPRANVGTVVIDGDLAPFNFKVLVDQMKRPPGRTYRLVDARNDADRMKNFLIRRDYKKADVRYVDQTYDQPTHSVTLRYRATVGPKVRVEVEGVPRRAVRKWLPFARNQEYSEDTIDRAADNIVTGYQQRGYYNAAVDTESGMQNGEWVTKFIVQPGQHYNLSAVTFSGNVKVSDKTLAGIAQTAPSGGISHLIATLFRRPTGPTTAEINADRDALESYYRLQGFPDATVATPVVRTNANGTMTVDFPITEGPQTLLAGVVVEGVEQVQPKELPELALKPGLPLNPQTLREDLVTLQTFYANRGNAEVQVTPRVEVSQDKTSANVTYVVAEGPQIKVGDVVVRGNTYTDSEVVLRKADLDKGDPFSYSSILEAQRELYRLGVFQRVEVQPEQAGTSVADRGVVIQVEEGKNLTISGAIGATAQRVGKENTIQPRLSTAIAHRNLFGTGRYLGLETIFSKFEQEAFLTYREPFIGRWNVPLQLTVFQTDDQTRPGTHIRQRGTFLEASKVARYQTRWSLRYEYKISDCIVEQEGDICSIVKSDLPVSNLDRSLANIQISSITPTFFWDRRDDIVDPHHGFFSSASIEYAFPLFAADAHFLKEFVQGAYYIPISARSVVALSGRVGLIHNYGKRDRFGRQLPVPLSERFTAGGETSHRAFPLDLLGTLCEDEKDFDAQGRCEPTLYRATPDAPILPLGGSGLFVLNAEYRFPIFSTLGGAVFADAGNVYANSTIRFHDLRYGLGFGLRYLSPVGPLRFDVGWPLSRRSYERNFSYFITLGYAF